MRNDDVVLVHHTLAGDETAFATLVEKYRKQIHELGALKDPQRLSGWLNAIAIRRCLAWFRERHLNVQLSENITKVT